MDDVIIVQRRQVKNEFMRSIYFRILLDLFLSNVLHARRCPTLYQHFYFYFFCFSGGYNSQPQEYNNGGLFSATAMPLLVINYP